MTKAFPDLAKNGQNISVASFLATCSLGLYTIEVEDELGPEGCYLVYEPDSGGRLMIVYSHGYVPMNAVGFWCAGEGKRIQGFKFKQAGGRSELIKGIAGGDSNRRKYFVGWCQFIKMAKVCDILEWHASGTVVVA